jgi:hypothetical protein
LADSAVAQADGGLPESDGIIMQEACMQRENKIEEVYLLQLLKAAIRPYDRDGAELSESAQSGTNDCIPETTDADWEKLLKIAVQHGVSSLLYDELVTKQRLPLRYRDNYEQKCRQTVLQNYRLLFMSKTIIEQLEQRGIQALILKGAGIAGMYPVPELRKSGDVDILLMKPEQIGDACRVLKDAGYAEDEVQYSLHHVALHSKEQIEVEVHTMLAEPFDNQKINCYMQEKIKAGSAEVVREDVMGICLPRLGDAEQAYALLLHMLQHFLRSGFGLKLLCDWTVFWNHPHDRWTQETYLELIRESGLEGFSDMTTAVCVYYLGLGQEQVQFMFQKSGRMIPTMQDAEAFLEEILDAGEFGKDQKDRMVTLRGTGIGSYMREFHHQMHLNYPKAGRIFLLWPALWGSTLYRFLKNNRKLRHIPAAVLLKKAGERSRITEKMALFQRRQA